jgi:hypothetical protein
VGPKSRGCRRRFDRFPRTADPEELFADRDANVCGNCLRILTEGA